jgi:hypothetical protein
MSMFGKRNLFRDSANKLEEERLSDTFRGTVAGVHFDLRHKLIDPKKWALPRLITERPPGHPGFYVAPDPSTKNLFRASLAPDLDESLLQAVREKGLDILFAGDRVRVTTATVVDVSNGDPFALAPDRQAAELSLRVTRESGAQERLQPLYIWPRGSKAASYGGDILARLADRIESLERTPPEQSEELRGLVAEVRDLKWKLESALWESVRAREDGKDLGLAGNVGAALPTIELRRLVNLATLFGYQQGLAEASHEMRPLAQRSIERKEQTKAAGRAGRLTSRVTFAKEYWAKHPEASAYRVAIEFKAEFKDSQSLVQSIIRSIMPLCPSTSPSFKKTAV